MSDTKHIAKMYRGDKPISYWCGANVNWSDWYFTDVTHAALTESFTEPCLQCLKGIQVALKEKISLMESETNYHTMPSELNAPK